MNSCAEREEDEKDIYVKMPNLKSEGLLGDRHALPSHTFHLLYKMAIEYLLMWQKKN